MVYLNLADEVAVNSKQVSEKMRRSGVLVDAENGRRFRLVTHFWIDDTAVERTISAFGESLN